MRLVTWVSCAEIQPWVKERLAAEAVTKTNGWQGYSFLEVFPSVQDEWLVPISGKTRRRSCPGSIP